MCAPAAFRSASSTCCIGAISSASCRGSGFPISQTTIARDLNLAWHRLDGWPDVAPGLAQLRKRHLLAPPVSQWQHLADEVDLARRNNFPWDVILGAETAGDYKPKPRVYLAACVALDLPPGECMMVAAHTNDLLAAAACGLRTAHIRATKRARAGHGRESAQGAGGCRGGRPEDLAAGSMHEVAAGP